MIMNLLWLIKCQCLLALFIYCLIDWVIDYDRDDDDDVVETDNSNDENATKHVSDEDNNEYIDNICK